MKLPCALCIGLPILAYCVVRSALAAAPSNVAPRAWLEDAELADVCFVNAAEGWAVGDRGVIWHTDDGGQNWKLQRTEQPNQLTGAAFADSKRGWAVGGSFFAYLPGSRGVILHTSDGGNTWKSSENLLLPALRGVTAFDASRALVWGAASPIFPHGLFRTGDGGQGWNPLAGATIVNYRDVAFTSPEQCVALSASGAIRLVRGESAIEVSHPNAGLRSPHRVRFSDPHHGVIVGDGGLVWITTDGGQTWTPPPAFPAERARQFDFTALAVRASHVWIAGSPGTRVFHSPDWGRNWELLDTLQTLPLNSICFVDDERGWAVGALGRILATPDGGRTWRVQRSGGDRTAVWGAFARAERTPWELFAQLCGQDGQLGAAYFIERRIDRDTVPDDVDSNARLQTAMTIVGGASARRAWRFPAPSENLAMPAERIVANWDAHHGSDGIEELQLDLVRQLRTWRPDVVFTHAANTGRRQPVDYVINQAVLAAAERAADPEFAPTVTRDLGLAPWRVTKVFGWLPKGESGSHPLATTQLSLALGRSLADQADNARAFVCDDPVRSPPVWGFQLLESRQGESGHGKGYMSGAKPSGDANAQRPHRDLESAQTGPARERAMRQRNVQAILAQAGDAAGDASLAQVMELANELDAGSAPRVIFSLASRYREAGRGELAAEVFGRLVERYPNDELAAPAIVWLIQYWSSAEAALHRSQRGGAETVANVQTGQFVVGDQGVQRAEFLSRQSAPVPQPAAGTSAVDPRESARASRVLALHKLLHRTRPTLAAEPFVVLPLTVLQRRADSSTDAQRLLQGLARSGSAWRHFAAAELWQLNPQDKPCPRPTCQCRRAASRPRLDGSLDEDLWRSVEPISLHGPFESGLVGPTTAAFAHDDEFLYIGVVAHVAPGHEYAPATGRRNYDADLADADRVEVAIDVDRDYVTAWRLSLDYRGRTHDSCWSDDSWNPRWFVASKQAQETWCVEAAVTLDQLTPRQPAPTTAWSLDVERIVPGVGVQSWTVPRPENASLLQGGWLVFE